MAEPLPQDQMDEIGEMVERIATKVAREEVASLSGMILRRLQDMGPTRSPERNMAVEILSELFGEALRDFSATTSEPGAKEE